MLGQSFSHSIGPAILASEETIGAGLVYSPRINIIHFNDAITTSIGTHIALAANTDEEIGSFIGVELPIMLELNFGANSYPENDSSFGGFIGVGYGFSTFSASDPGETFTKGVFYNVGFSIQGNLGIRFAYLENFDPNTFGGASITLQLNLN